MTYLDITFCVSPGCTNKCGRKLTPEIRASAIKDWGGDDAPISVARFCDLSEEHPPFPVSRAVLRRMEKYQGELEQGD